LLGVVLLVELLQALESRGSCSHGGGHRGETRLVRMRMWMSTVKVTSTAGHVITIKVVYTLFWAM